MVKVRGYAALEAGLALTPFVFERREPGPHDIEIAITHSGICHSDIHQARQEWGPSLFPMVPGHEILGDVVRVGSDVTRFKVGDVAGVGVFVDTCRECQNCLNGLEQYCTGGMVGTYNSKEKDGKTLVQGGYSTGIVVDQRYALHIPAALPRAGAAPLMCAGITLYSPLRHWDVGPGKKVAIMGLGGLGHMGVKIAVAMGAEVTVLSHSTKKRDDALAMGATEFIDVSEKSAFKSASKRFDLIMNTVSADIVLDSYLSLLRIDGSLVLIGIPGKPYEINVGTLLTQRRSIAGSMIGSIVETQVMLNFCAENSITSDVEVISAHQINTAYDRAVASDVRYRFVIDASTF